ncbi:hypothetical protein [Naasia lichenicola]|uniref:Uncharacterized protein n=1 Tax=Naasia lichenicola TaxID=2565933 RepID=A0A4S4FRS4_9MICO|nr:hypothetical protein [Naasia lichenicola]THG33380.1 hypothetical protein E6C64_03250 [Naasia lichenicola]
MPIPASIGSTMPWPIHVYRPPSSYTERQMRVGMLDCRDEIAPQEATPTPVEHAEAQRIERIEQQPVQHDDFTPWDVAAAGLTWVPVSHGPNSQASQGAGSAFVRNLGRRATPEVFPGSGQLL